jgi:hypothetical protein
MVYGTGGGSDEVTETSQLIGPADTSDDEHEILC